MLNNLHETNGKSLEYYNAGINPLMEITDGTIRKHAKRVGWVRSLTARRQAKADNLVRRQEVRKEVRNESEKEIIAANANA